jgi:hypothetical protein
MSEKMAPFSAGVSVKETCWLGLRGDITLVKPEEMDDGQFKEYLESSRETCCHCAFEKKFLCSRIDEKGTASADAFAGEVEPIESTLKELKAPCVGTKVIAEVLVPLSS